MISLGVLSWRAHETLRRTLTSYAALRPLVDEAVVFFNEISDHDRALAAEFGFRAEGSPDNLGLLDGTRGLFSCLHGDQVLSLQNDCPVNVPPDVLAARLADARAALASGAADVVRLRDRFAPGFSDAPNFLKFYPGPGTADTPALRLNRLLRPFKARRLIGRAVAVLPDPAAAFPSVFRREGDLFIADSRYLNFTDQPFLIGRDLFARLFDYAEFHRAGSRTLNGRPVLEIILNCRWWRAQRFRIAVSDGVFAHARFDDSFRPGHAAFNASLARQ